MEGSWTGAQAPVFILRWRLVRPVDLETRNWVPSESAVLQLGDFFGQTKRSHALEKNQSSPELPRRAVAGSG